MADEIPSSTTPPNWDDCPVSVPLRMALPAQYVDINAGSASTRIAAQPDASARSDDAHTAAQYPEEQGQCVRYRREQVAMRVESTDFPIQNVESMQSNSIQTAYATAPVITRQPKGTTLRWGSRTWYFICQIRPPSSFTKCSVFPSFVFRTETVFWGICVAISWERRNLGPHV